MIHCLLNPVDHSICNNVFLPKQNKAMKKELKMCYERCRKLEENDVNARIQDLPKPQQEAVLACLAAAKVKGRKNGRRFRAAWAYECLLMRIKGPALYEHIRKEEILILPVRTTLNRYMRKLPPQYGFQPALFDVLKHKVSSMPPF